MNYASKSQAENGTDNTTVMTPLRTKQAIQANSSSSPGGTTNYNDLTNKPKINNVELSGNKTTSDLGIVENVQADWNTTTTTDPSYIKNKPTIPVVPTNVSAFTNDVGYLTTETDPVFSASAAHGITSSDINSWNNKQEQLVSGTNIKTINNQSLLGSGDITIQGGGNTYYFDGQDNAANVAMINEICDAYDNGDEINFTGKFADGTTGLVFQAPINVTKYATSSMNNTEAFVSEPVLWFDSSTSPATPYYLTFALYLEGTWGNYTSVSQYRAKTLTPSEWDAKQDALVSGTNIKTINNNSLLGSGNISTANNRRGFFGTCSTAADTAAKVVTLSDTSGWELKAGTIVGVKFTNANTASNVTLNVNSTGAKSIYSGNAVYTGSNWQITGGANYIHYYMYDGTYWVFLNVSNNIYNDSNTYTSAYCTTAAGTAAKTASCTNYSLLSNSYLHITITNANSYEGAITLNVNGKGAKPIYINGSASSSSNHTLPAGTYIVFYNGTNYYFRTDGKLQGNISGSANSASKLGSSNVGNATTPIYLNGGTPTAGTQIEDAGYRGVKTRTSKGNLGWGTNNDYVPDMGMLAYWDGAYSGTSSNLTYAHQGTIQCKPTSLYSNSTGVTSGTITLSETSANFNYLEIFYYYEDSKAYSSINIFSPNGKKALLEGTYDNGTYLYKVTDIWTISGTSLSKTSGTRWRFGTSGNPTRSSGTTLNDIYIYKVIGYK